MNIKYINIKRINKPKVVWFVVILVFLIAIYITLEIFESSDAVANEVQFHNNVEDKEFVIGGESCGIKLLATGVLVVEVDNKASGLIIGDVILEVNGNKIDSNKELIKYINEEYNEKNIIKLTVQRDEKEINIIPEIVINKETKKYELGVWVKDSSAGVGIVTFYELNNKYFAALGHGITETSKNIIVPIQSGAIVKSKITGINRGYSKEPGDLKGTIYKEVYGQIRKNTINGIYGVLEKDNLIDKKETIEVAYKNEIKTGKAKIYCTLDDNEVKTYDIKIMSVIYDSTGNKNMIIQVTDKELLEKTGGIVQGMSGSPIVQNGKLIGAVTHVFLNDPTKGYAVFIEHMIKDMEGIE